MNPTTRIHKVNVVMYLVNILNTAHDLCVNSVRKYAFSRTTNCSLVLGQVVNALVTKCLENLSWRLCPRREARKKVMEVVLNQSHTPAASLRQ